MQKITVNPSVETQKACTIYIGNGVLEQIGSLYDLKQYSKLFVVTDETIQPLLLDRLTAALPMNVASVALPAGEQHKHIDSVQKIWTALHEAGCDRQSLVINLGGGVIGDLGGFAASTYMRGVDFLNVPTTLLAQVDASLGGKTGFNFAGIKNLIGSFNHPIGIVIDLQILGTLPKREFISGFGEIIKHGLVWDASHFHKATAKQPLQFTQEELADIIAESCHIKLAIIESDMHEGSVRKLVNFGHTIGHAVEALSLETNTPLLHGEAVSVGMTAEATISHNLGLLSNADLRRIRQGLENAGLPVAVHGQRLEDILKKMQSDKKNNDGRLNFTLLDGIGHALYNQQVPLPVVTEAIQAIIDR
jgi:3-dehydroquinate synthase